MKKPSRIPSKSLSQPLPTTDTPATALASPPPTSNALPPASPGVHTCSENCGITAPSMPSGRPNVLSDVVSPCFGFRCSVPSPCFAPCAMFAVRRPDATPVRTFDFAALPIGRTACRLPARMKRSGMPPAWPCSIRPAHCQPAESVLACNVLTSRTVRERSNNRHAWTCPPVGRFRKGRSTAPLEDIAKESVASMLRHGSGGHPCPQALRRCISSTASSLHAAAGRVATLPACLLLRGGV